MGFDVSDDANEAFEHNIADANEQTDKEVQETLELRVVVDKQLPELASHVLMNSQTTAGLVSQFSSMTAQFSQMALTCEGLHKDFARLQDEVDLLTREPRGGYEGPDLSENGVVAEPEKTETDVQEEPVSPNKTDDCSDLHLPGVGTEPEEVGEDGVS